MMKFLTMGTAVRVIGLVIGLNMVRVSVPVNTVELLIFPTITLVNVIMVELLLKNLDEGEENALRQEMVLL